MRTQTINNHLHNRRHRHRLFVGIAACLVELVLIFGVEAAIVHALVAIGLVRPRRHRDVLGDG